jgi:multidrug resistance efflux pump
MSEPRTPTAEPAPGANGELRNRVQQVRLDTQLAAAKAGRGGTSWLPWVLCALLALTWAGVAVRSYRNAEAERGTDAAAGPAAGSSPAAAAGKIEVEVHGYFIPARQIAVSPIDVGGRLIELNFVEGTRYEAGHVLAKIDPASYEAARAEAAAMLAVARARQTSAEQRYAEMTRVQAAEVVQVKALIDEAKAQEKLAETEYARVFGLASSTPQERDRASADRLAGVARVAKLTADLEILEKGRPAKIQAAKADAEAAAADVAAAEARLTQAACRVENCVIKAPITGTVLTKKAEKGNLVNPMAFGATSGAVCDMADLADLEIDLKVAEKEISKIHPGQRCRVRADAYPGRPYGGRLDRIMPIANQADNTVNVRVKVELPPGEAPGTFLKPNMGALVTFLPPDGEGK